MACLLAVYATDPGRGEAALTEPLLMMRPPCGACSFMSTYASLATWKAASRLIPTTERQSAMDIASTVVVVCCF